MEEELFQRNEKCRKAVYVNRNIHMILLQMCEITAAPETVCYAYKRPKVENKNHNFIAKFYLNFVALVYCLIFTFVLLLSGIKDNILKDI